MITPDQQHQLTAAIAENVGKHRRYRVHLGITWSRAGIQQALGYFYVRVRDREQSPVDPWVGLNVKRLLPIWHEMFLDRTLTPQLAWSRYCKKGWQKGCALRAGRGTLQDQMYFRGFLEAAWYIRDSDIARDYEHLGYRDWRRRRAQ